MQKLLERVDKLLGDYCKGAGCKGRRFRHIAAKDLDGNTLCAECVQHNLAFAGYRYKPEKEKETVLKPDKIKRIAHPNRLATGEMREELAQTILEVLKGSAYTNLEILPFVSSITRSQQTLNRVLYNLRRLNQIASIRLSPCGRMAYILPGHQNMARDRFGLKTEKVRKVLRLKVLETLQSRVCTNKELLTFMETITTSQGTLNIVLWQMRRDKEIIGVRLVRRGKMAYTLPGNEKLVRDRFALSYEQQVLDLLEEGKTWFMSDLALRVGTQRTIVNRWVKNFEQKGIVKTAVVSIPGEKGTRKVCFNGGDMNLSTAILVADLEGKRGTTTNPHYEKVLELAKVEYFNYLRSPLPSPSEVLIKNLVRLGFYDLVEKAQQGAYDATGDVELGGSP